jgi:hypothetical protein
MENGIFLGPAETGDPPNPPVELLRWQRTLLPFMMLAISVVAIYFFVSTSIQLRVTEARLEDSASTRQVSDLLAIMTKKLESPPDSTAESIEFNTRAALEATALEARYHEADVVLITRLWIKYLTFLTGMILAFVGSIFILGKMTETPSQFSGDAGVWKFAAASASPGLVLAFLGTILMVVGLLVQFPVDVKDSPVYLQGTTINSGPQSASQLPEPLDPFTSKSGKSAPRASNAGSHKQQVNH